MFGKKIQYIFSISFVIIASFFLFVNIVFASPYDPIVAMPTASTPVTDVNMDGLLELDFGAKVNDSNLNNQIKAVYEVRIGSTTGSLLSGVPDGNFVNAVDPSVSRNISQMKLTNLVPGTTYYYKVKAVNSIGEESAYSPWWQVVPSSGGVTLPGYPPIPAFDTISVATTTPTNTTVTWTYSGSWTGLYGYTIYRKLSTDTNWTAIATVPYNYAPKSSYNPGYTTAYSVYQYTDSGLVAGASYDYKVDVYTASTGQYYPANTHGTPIQASVTMPGYLTIPTFDTISATSTTPTNITVTWTYSGSWTGLYGYTIYRKLSTASTWTPIITLPYNYAPKSSYNPGYTVAYSTYQYTDSGLVAGSTYYYKVDIYTGSTGQYYPANTHGEPTVAGDLYVHCTDCIATVAPAVVSTSSCSVPLDVLLSWNPMSISQTKYSIALDINDHATSSLDALVDGSGNSLPLKTNKVSSTISSFDTLNNVYRSVNLNYGVNYYWWVNVWSDSLTSDWIAGQNFLVNCAAPPEVINPQVPPLSSSALCSNVLDIQLIWGYQGDTPQSAYQIIVDTVNHATSTLDALADGSGTSTPLVTNKILAGATSFYPRLNIYRNIDLGYGVTYYWWARVWDTNDSVSNWVAGPSFTTEPHQYPLSSFYWLPQEPSLGEKVNFYDTSQAYGGMSIADWLWIFDMGVGGPGTISTTTRNPVMDFAVSGLNNVSLTVTDSDGHVCTTTKDMNVNMNLPRWKEVK